MIPINPYCHQVTSWISNLRWQPNFLKGKPSITCALVILIGLTLFGIAIAKSILWKRLQQFQENNETHDRLSKLFKNVFGEARDEIDDESLTPNPSSPILPDEANQMADLAVDDISDQILSSSLITLRATLMNKGLLHVQLDGFGSGMYESWYDPVYHIVHIDDKKITNNKINITLDQSGEINSLHAFNGSKTMPVPFFRALMHAFFKAAFKASSSYSCSRIAPRITIQTVQKGIRATPEFHLQKLAYMIEKSNSVRKQSDCFGVNVKFLNDDLSDADGVGGGLSFDYLNDLFDSMIHNHPHSFPLLTESSLILPRTKKKYVELQPLPKLDRHEKSLYQAMGKVIMYCYLSKDLTNSWGSIIKPYFFGRFFDDALFNAILCLDSHEIDIPFENLTLQTQLKMCNALLAAREEMGMDVDYLKKRSERIDKFDSLDDSQILEAADEVLLVKSLPATFLENGSDKTPDLNKIKNNKYSFKAFLTDFFFSQEGAHGQLGVQLAPIHAIAQGMQSICPANGEFLFKLNHNKYWDKYICPLDYQTFSGTVQGSLDRNEIANQFTICDGTLARIEIEKKVKWIKRWITDTDNGATDVEVKNFLKFLTGSSCISKDKKIFVYSQYDSFYPVPVAHTCSSMIELAPTPCRYGPEHDDFTYENFTKCLRELALANPSGYQMD
jgi:hypothetical protein